MKFIFPILAIVVCCAAIYFSLSEKERFETEQEARLLAVNTNANVAKSLAEATLEIDESKKSLVAAKEQLATDAASFSFLESTVGNLKKEIEGLDFKLAQLGQESKENEDELAEFELIFQGGNVTKDNFQAKFNEVESEITEKQARLDEIDTLIEGAEASLASKKAEVTRLIGRMETRNRRIARNAMEARITAVDNDWGFLVIGAGSNSGFTPSTSLLVKRDGRLIGRVNPSAVEPTQTIAEIDSDTLAPGVRIQPGDRVILAKPAQN